MPCPSLVLNGIPLGFNTEDFDTGYGTWTACLSENGTVLTVVDDITSPTGRHGYLKMTYPGLEFIEYQPFDGPVPSDFTTYFATDPANSDVYFLTDIGLAMTLTRQNGPTSVDLGSSGLLGGGQVDGLVWNPWDDMIYVLENTSPGPSYIHRFRPSDGDSEVLGEAAGSASDLVACTPDGALWVAGNLGGDPSESKATRIDIATWTITDADTAPSIGFTATPVPAFGMPGAQAGSVAFTDKNTGNGVLVHPDMSWEATECEPFPGATSLGTASISSSLINGRWSTLFIYPTFGHFGDQGYLLGGQGPRWWAGVGGWS